MQINPSTVLLALVVAAFATPVKNAVVEKRAVCTSFGFTYLCAGAATTTALATTTKPASTTVKAATITTAKSSAAAGTSTGGGASASATGITTYTGGSTAQDVVNGVCAPLTVIFARGTSEPGTVGYVAGPPMFTQLSKDLNKKVALQGVDYAADAAGNSNCGSAGSATMVSLVKQALSQCPGTKIAISGYSQGACVVHTAAKSLTASQIQAVVVFGDPFNGQAVGSVPSSEVLEICGSSDSICDGGGSTNVSGGHTDYGSDGAMAASFIEKTTGVTA